MIAGCGGGGTDAPVAGTPNTTTNTAPTISGTPALAVTAGQPYSFTPTAADADGDSLTFSIQSQPAWSSFDTATGSLSGTPGTGDVGMTMGVIISVSDGQSSASLAPFDLQVSQLPVGSAAIFWETPTTNADGSMLTDLAGFNIHYGQISGTYTEMAVINDSTATSAQIDGLQQGSWHFAVSAFDTAGNRSSLSDEVDKVVN